MQTKIISIPTNSDERGKLSFMQTPDQIPFEIKRLYYIYKLSGNSSRGHHAHKKTEQILFCIQGSVTIIFDDAKEKKDILLNKADVGLFIPALMWHEMKDYSEDCIMLVLASDIYKEDDYIRDYQDFLGLVTK